MLLIMQLKCNCRTYGTWDLLAFCLELVHQFLEEVEGARPGANKERVDAVRECDTWFKFQM